MGDEGGFFHDLVLFFKKKCGREVGSYEVGVGWAERKEGRIEKRGQLSENL